MPSEASLRGLLRRLPGVRFVLVVHLVLLIAIRLYSDADDFNNWDLISFLNANAFPSLTSLLALPEVHLRRPFSFPVYNTGAESVVSILVHRAMSGVSLYWSNVVVLVLYDVIFLAGLGRLFRLVFDDRFLVGLGWVLLAMSPVVLTFASVSAFNMQAFATITWALVGCELVLKSRRLSGILLLAVAFVWISQAYPLTFFMPLFCLVWTTARVVMLHSAGADGLRRNAAVLVAMVVCGVTAVELGSTGRRLHDALGVVSDRAARTLVEAGSDSLADRIAWLLRVAFAPTDATGSLQAGFAPCFLLVVLLVLAAVAVGLRRTAPTGPEESSATPRQAPRGPWSALAWTGLVAFGYMPALFGSGTKSQRCEFGDLFLVMAVVALAAWVGRRVSLRQWRVIVPLVLLLGLSDAWYLSSVLGVDHSRPHDPVFDYDTSDGLVRHDMVSVIKQMREQTAGGHAGLIVYYPRGLEENRTDPAMFFARFLRHFGPYQGREDLLFPCRFCELRYGCPFPEVRKRSCGKECCYTDPVKELERRPQLGGRRLYLWWYSDPAFEDEPRRSNLLSGLRRRYRVKDLGSPAVEKRWQCWELAPRPSGKGGV